MALKGVIVVAALSLTFVLGLGYLVTAAPSGATLNEIRSESATNDTAGSHGAFAGNVTELVLTGVSTTQSWQGYFGNVSGAIQLGDGSGNVLYNWSTSTPGGEVYASTNVTLNWTEVQCFNFTAAGNHTFAGETAGSTSLYGTNVTQLEAQYGIGTSDVDGVNETFTIGAGGHDLFFTGSLEFSEGECRSTLVFDSNGEGTSNNFEEALLYDPSTSSVVFASIIESGTVGGFDGNNYDFEMLVLEDGHSGDTSTTTYYFFVELE